MLDQNKKTIVFDFGNVLIDLNFERCFSMFEDILNVDWSDRKLPQPIINAIQKYDRGHISDEALIWAFQNENPSCNPRDIIKAWNSLIGEMPSSRFDLLLQLRKKYNLCILSNINNLHLTHILKYFKSTYDVTDFEDRYFDRVFYSHFIGKRKPDEEVYSFVTNELKIEPNTILFIDDLQENIDAAKRYGWNGSVHDPKIDIIDKVNCYIEDANF